MENTNVEVKATIQLGRYIIIAHDKHKGLINREVEVTKESKKAGFVNGHLFDSKKGELQKTEISIAFTNLELKKPELALPAPEGWTEVG